MHSKFGCLCSVLVLTLTMYRSQTENIDMLLICVTTREAVAEHLLYIFLHQLSSILLSWWVVNLLSPNLCSMVFSGRIHLLYQNHCFDKSVLSSYICRNDSLCQPLDYSTIKDLRSSNIQTVMTFNKSISFCNQVS